MKCKKVGYDTFEIATERMQTIQQIDDGRRKPNRVYKCDMCGEYHLSSQDKGTHIRLHKVNGDKAKERKRSKQQIPRPRQRRWI